METIKNLQSILTTHPSTKVKSCVDHINLVMDIIIDECETFPEVIQTTSGQCALCEKEAKYEVFKHED